ncbi:MAG: methyltransferase [Euryarchaeota archaeon]|nr:methyltransferase [Euryarchaeota archaeon]MDE1837596.1 methyltransferase [Euryarchaeota archaeon]MDE1881249.1 methyltransferase [Euryarchaeota archaeon]MDE2045907.1 methyltransferase [Thermoplasmata archaeon]
MTPPFPGAFVRLWDLDLSERPHVYPPREDSLLLASSAGVKNGERVLEVGCGLGLASLSAARAGGRVVASDVNPYAVQAVREEALARGLQLDTVRADLFRGLGRFDVVLSNPPYLPSSPSLSDPDVWQERAVDGGEDGLAFVRRFIEELPDHLTEDGRAYLLVASLPQAPIRTRGLPVRSSRVVISDLVGDRVLPAETLWVLELRASEVT